MMALQTIHISIGGYALEQDVLKAALSKFPDFKIIPLDNFSKTEVLIWDINKSQSVEFPVIQPKAFVILLLGDLNFQSLPKNVSGLFSKQESLEALATAIRQVARGEQYISPPLALAYLESQQVQGQEMRDIGLEALSEREQEILDLLADGQSNKSIASRLYLSVRTVEGHLARIYAKLSVHSRTEAMLFAIENR